MKKLVVLILVLGLTACASAALKISVNGAVDPVQDIILFPSETVELDIWGDGLNVNPVAWMLVEGLGNINGSRMLYTGSLANYSEVEAKAAESEMSVPDYLAMIGSYFNMTDLTDLSVAEFVDGAGVPKPAGPGTLCDRIIFHCDGIIHPVADSIVILTLGGFDDDGNTFVYDRKIIRQVPEPMTVALLGLGGLFLRRRLA